MEVQKREAKDRVKNLAEAVHAAALVLENEGYRQDNPSEESPFQLAAPMLRGTVPSFVVMGE